jgi:hypothetical protein
VFELLSRFLDRRLPSSQTPDELLSRIVTAAHDACERDRIRGPQSNVAPRPFVCESSRDDRVGAPPLVSRGLGGIAIPHENRKSLRDPPFPHSPNLEPHLRPILTALDEFHDSPAEYQLGPRSIEELFGRDSDALGADCFGCEGQEEQGCESQAARHRDFPRRVRLNRSTPSRRTRDGAQGVVGGRELLSHLSHVDHVFLLLAT